MELEGPIEPDDAPVLLFHGADDFIVPTHYGRQAAMFAAKAKRLLGYVEYPGIGHTVFQQRGAESMPLMVRTLRSQLVGGAPCA
ncbi:MAG: hypothetical protein R2698_13255 [Microthrixaceae bacterium]